MQSTNTPHLPKTPYLHCLALAFIWYVAIVVLRFVTDAETGVAGVLVSLALGLVPWLLTSVALWRIAGGTSIKAWRLVLLGLPIFYFCWALTVVVAYRFAVPFVTPS